MVDSTLVCSIRVYLPLADFWAWSMWSFLANTFQSLKPAGIVSAFQQLWQLLDFLLVGIIDLAKFENQRGESFLFLPQPY
jgi:hypothetical protein